MKKITKFILSLLVITAVFVWVKVAKSPTADQTNNVNIYFFNVGQGDAELIQKGDYQILIDGGPDDDILSEIGKVMPLADRKIDQVILTHPHSDHITGLISALDRYEIGTIYSSGLKYDSNLYDEFLAKIKERNIQYKIPDIQETSTPFPNSTLAFLWPGQQYNSNTIDNANNASEVVKFCYFMHCALFTGDLETDGQAGMFAHYSSDTLSTIFNVDLLKISHHGSTNGINQLLLDTVQPKYAVIEVGANNSYGHPHAQTLNLLQKAGISTFRTDRDGTVHFIVNESGFIHQ